MKKINNKGFTLLEVVLVISIIGILITMIVPNFSRSQLSARVATHNVNVNMIKSAAALYLIDHPLEISKNIPMELLKQYLDKDSDLKLDPVLVQELESNFDKEFKVNINSTGDIEIIPGELIFKENKLVVKGSKEK